MRNQDWVALSDAQRGQLVSIWLLAADKKGKIPSDPQVIKKLCYMDTVPDLELFISHGFIDVDATVTPERRQHDQPETETETDKKQPCVEVSTRANGKEFERFWEHWPIKRNKKKARTAWVTKKFELADVDELIADVEARKLNDPQWKRGFIPHCSTYLNGERWEDDYADPKK